MCVGALTCGNGGNCLRANNGDDGPQLENTPSTCEAGACTDCGFKKLWSLGLRRTLYDYAASSEGAFDGIMRADCDPVFNSSVYWQSYVKKPRAPSTKELKDKEGDDAEYHVHLKTARDSILETQHGILVNFLDEFEEILTRHVPHRVAHECSKRASRQFNENRRPGDRGMSRDVDFSEDGNIENFNKLQSGAFRLLSFLSPLSFLFKEGRGRRERGRREIK